MFYRFIIIIEFFILFFYFYFKFFISYKFEIIKSLLILIINLEYYLTCFFDRDFEYNYSNLNKILLFLK